MTKGWRMASAACAALLAGSGVQAADYTVVVLQSLTGPAAFIGAPVKDGMVLAAEEINARQELGPGNTLKVIVADDATDRAQTLSLITRYAADPAILAVMGPTSGAVALAGANIANEAKIPVVTTTNSMEVLKNGPWSFILTQPATVTIPYLGRYAVETLKVKNCAVIGIRDNEAYVTLQKTFEDYITQNGVKIASNDGIKASDSDFSALATKIAGSKQDCIFVSAPAPQAANVVTQLLQGGVDPKIPILGHNSLASPEFVSKGGKAVEGVYLIGDWVPGGADDFGRAFAAAFKAKHNASPDNWSAVGYGGMRVVAAAIKNAGPNPTRDAVRDALGKVKDVRVVVGQGLYSMDAERVPRPGMNVLTVKDGGFVLAPK